MLWLPRLIGPLLIEANPAEPQSVPTLEVELAVPTPAAAAVVAQVPPTQRKAPEPPDLPASDQPKPSQSVKVVTQPGPIPPTELAPLDLRRVGGFRAVLEAFVATEDKRADPSSLDPPLPSALADGLRQRHKSKANAKLLADRAQQRNGLAAQDFKRQHGMGDVLKTKKGCFVLQQVMGMNGMQTRWWRTACLEGRRSAFEQSVLSVSAQGHLTESDSP